MSAATKPKKAPSARGLFRATGKTSNPVAVQAELATGEAEIVRAAQLEREKDDFYATPIEGIRAFVAHEGARLKTLGQPVWESAVGDGAIARELAAFGLPVIGSDLVDRGFDGVMVGDYFDYTLPTRLSPVMVTNPPYDQINWRDGQGRWLTHARDTLQCDYVALLLNWSWPGAAGLGAVWDADPAARVYLMQWKLDFTGQGAPPMLSGWFVWDGKTALGDTRFLLMRRDDDWRQGRLI